MSRCGKCKRVTTCSYPGGLINFLDDSFFKCTGYEPKEEKEMKNTTTNVEPLIGVISTATSDKVKHPELVRKVRAVGESLIKNAESIVGSEEYLRGISIITDIDFEEIPEIDVHKRFYPEGYANVKLKGK